MMIVGDNMCGRFYYDKETFKILKTIVDKSEYEDEECYDYCPGNKIPVILMKDKELTLIPLTWGYTLQQNAQRVINARRETLLQKKIFSEDVMLHRCIIPAKGFNIWDQNHHKLSLEINNKKMLFMAGIYREKEKEVTIITIPSNKIIRSIHPRSPLIIPYEDIKRWLCDNQLLEKFLLTSLTEIKIVDGLFQQSLFDEAE